MVWVDPLASEKGTRILFVEIWWFFIFVCGVWVAFTAWCLWESFAAISREVYQVCFSVFSVLCVSVRCIYLFINIA